MRCTAVLLAATALSTAASAEPTRQPAPSDVEAAQKALRDPRTAETMSRVTGALARAVMALPVGELEAAVEGRAPNEADRKRTVQDSLGGPAEAARIEREVAGSGAQMQAMGNALANALPGMIAAAGAMQKEVEKATANLPDPTYPRR